MTITAIKVQAGLPIGSPTVFELLGLNDTGLVAGAKAAMDAGAGENVDKSIALLQMIYALPATLRAKIVQLYSPQFILRNAGSGSQIFSLTSNRSDPAGQAGTVPVSTVNGHLLLDFATGTVGMKAAVSDALLNGAAGMALFSVFRAKGNAAGAATAFGIRSENATYSTRQELVKHVVTATGVVQHVGRRSQANSGALVTINEGATSGADGAFHRHLTTIDGTLGADTIKAYKDNVLAGTGSIPITGTIGLFAPAFVDLGAFFGTGGPIKAPVEFACGIVFAAILTEAERGALDAFGAALTA